MATQSLYRRYRPRRFSEVRGQDHVVQALRTSVAEGREGQAYLFSGPRGTGKTTSARILAKVLNCTNAQDGEPCCECESCRSVERGTSYDVHELDAASNNGVEAMRDLIDKASLGTPGRHKVYILDEVHMLTKPAEAALLKTLEEPPPHVVFVLATTDPQKVSDTIRSRTQHLQFHLLPADTLLDHVRWVAEDAGLTVSDDAIDQVLAQGGGSARDTLSALELVANSGGVGAETVAFDEFVEAMIDLDPGRALTMVAGAIGLGRDPRAVTEGLIAYLRNGFLSLMAPDLVQLPSNRVDEVADQAQRLGAAGLVRGIEQLGAALNEMRHAPDPRVLLDVATVKLTALADVGVGAAPATAAPAAAAPATSGRPAPAPRPAQPDAAPAPAPVDQVPRDQATGRAQLGGRVRRAASTAPTDATDATEAAASSPPQSADDSTASPVPDEAPSTPAPVAPSNAPGFTRAMWDDTVKPSLRGMARAVFAPATFVGCTSSVLTLALPNSAHRDKCEEHRDAVEAALRSAAGGAVTLDLVVEGDGGAAGGNDSVSPTGSTGEAPVTDQPSAAASEPGTAQDSAPQSSVDTAAEAAQEESETRAGVQEPTEEVAAESVTVADLPEDHEVDLDELVDAPPSSVKTPIDRLADAFPGSELVDDVY